MNLDEFLSRSDQLLKLERAAEEEAHSALLEDRTISELCHSGVCLTKLHLVTHRSTYAGRRILKFARKHVEPFPAMPNHKFSSGDLVSITPSHNHRIPIMSGVVSRVRENVIYVTCERSEDYAILDADNRTFALVLEVNDVTYRRLNTCLDRLKNYEYQHGRSLVEIMFGDKTLPFIGEHAPISCLDPALNQSQLDAVQFSVHPERLISLIHGPPGTGKTRTVVEVIRQSVAQGLKVLLCAPSNVAVDNVLSRLQNTTLRMVRLGHPARSDATLHALTLDAKLSKSDQAQLIDDIRNELETPRMPRERRKQLKKELGDREKRAMLEVLGNSDVVCATLTTADPMGPLKCLEKRGFDLVVIDECAQALEVACWSALLQAKRCVLAGDHRQLPPTIISEQASRTGLSLTLMERLERQFPKFQDELFRLLTVQYRMNQLIMEWSSKQFYSNQLEADSSVRDHLLSEISSQSEVDTENMGPLLIIDTDGMEMNELETELDESKANIGEVKLVYLQVKNLVQSGVNQQDISIISPYNLQVQLLRTYVGNLYPNVSIRSVDGFQGQEREAVVLSLVRSNLSGTVGFLSDNRRINVAVTRARRHLCVICDSHTVKNDKIISTLLEHISSVGETRHAAEFADALASVPFEIDVSTLMPPKESPAAKRDTVPKTKQEKLKQLKKFASKPAENVPKIMQKEPSTEPPSWQEKLLDEIQNFLKGEETEFEFPPSLDSRQRYFVHEIAEQKGLIHKSSGEGQERRIILGKHPETVETELEQKEKETVQGLHSENEQSVSKPEAPKAAKPKPKQQKKPKPKPLPEDDDTLMAQFTQEHSSCCFETCKQLTNLIAVDCKFCTKRFCLNHGQSEVHGCGAAAKTEARKVMKDEFAGLMGKKESKKNEEKHTILKKKMNDKMKAMEGGRKGKKK